MKKSVCLSLILFVCVVKTYAQVDYKYALKLYSVHSLSKNYTSTGATAFNYSIWPSFGFQWYGSERQWNEIQIKQGAMNIGKSTQSFMGLGGQNVWTEGRNTYKLINVSYEHNWNVFKTPHKLMPSLGGGVQGQFSQGRFKDGYSESRTNSWGVTATTYFVPRLTYNISPRLFLDVNAQINLLSLRLDGSKNVNTYNKTNFSALNTKFNFLQNNTLKLGLGYRF